VEKHEFLNRDCRRRPSISWTAPLSLVLALLSFENETTYGKVVGQFDLDWECFVSKYVNCRYCFPTFQDSRERSASIRGSFFSSGFSETAHDARKSIGFNDLTVLARS
jgi:hypothetical protein